MKQRKGEVRPLITITTVPHEPIMGDLRSMYYGHADRYLRHKYTPWMLSDYIEKRGVLCLKMQEDK